MGGDIHMAHASMLSTSACFLSVSPIGTCCNCFNPNLRYFCCTIFTISIAALNRGEIDVELLDVVFCTNILSHRATAKLKSLTVCVGCWTPFLPIIINKLCSQSVCCARLWPGPRRPRPCRRWCGSRAAARRARAGRCCPDCPTVPCKVRRYPVPQHQQRLIRRGNASIILHLTWRWVNIYIEIKVWQHPPD